MGEKTIINNISLKSSFTAKREVMLSAWPLGQASVKGNKAAVKYNSAIVIFAEVSS